MVNSSPTSDINSQVIFIALKIENERIINKVSNSRLIKTSSLIKKNISSRDITK